MPPQGGIFLVKLILSLVHNMQVLVIGNHLE
jgi:hypothetical protein